MATTNFIDYQTKIEAEWLNEVDALVWDIFGGATTDSEARTNLGLDSMALQNAASVAITGGSISGVTLTGGSISGITDLAVADGGTGASTAAGARTNLGAAASATIITAGEGLTGGGDLSANRTIALDVNGLTAESSLDNSSDYVPVYDASAGAHRKVLLEDIILQDGGTFVNAADGGPYISSTVFRIDSDIGATWESIGPTGSGATNIWTALDSVPAGADWIEVRIEIQLQADIAGSPLKSYASVYARKNGSSITAGTGRLIATASTLCDTTTHTVDDVIVSSKIPVSGSNVFDLSYTTNNVFTDYCNMYLVGYGSNP